MFRIGKNGILSPLETLRIQQNSCPEDRLCYVVPKFYKPTHSYLTPSNKWSNPVHKQYVILA